MKPAWLDRAVFYQVYPQSFQDDNGDGIGDLPGLLRRLPQIAALGANALWLNPVYDSPFRDAGYDVRDHRRIAPRYGRQGDLDRLVARAHELGLKVCLDLVPGHTSEDHPWFVASRRRPRGPLSDRYVWSDDPWLGREGPLTYVTGASERQGAHAVNFFVHQPALNYGFERRTRPHHQAPDEPGPRDTVAALKAVMAHWLDRGVDGFRVDLASSLVKADPHGTGARTLWRELRDWMDGRWSERVLIAEWGHPELAAAAGFHVDFMLHFGVPGYPELCFDEHAPRQPHADCWLRRGPGGDFGPFARSFRVQWRGATALGGAVGLPSGNHDFQRIRSPARDPRDLEVWFAFLLTFPCVPFIYYGDEIGLRHQQDVPSVEGGYERCGARTPMQWDEGPNAGFSSAPPERLYLPQDPGPDRPTVAAQRADPSSLWHVVRRLAELRSARRELAPDAALEFLVETSPGVPLAYRRGGLVIALNPGDAPATLAIPAAGPLGTLLGARHTLEGNRLRLESRGWAVLGRP